MDSNHLVPVIRVSEIRKHPNADSLGLVDIGAYQVVVKLGEYTVGDLALYVQPDSVLPDEPQYAWFWGPGTFEGGTPEKKRRVTVRRFRKEWSEGLLLPLQHHEREFWVDRELGSGMGERRIVAEGDNLAEFLGIEHYNPPEPGEIQHGSSVRQSRSRPKSLKGWFYFFLNNALYYGSFGMYHPWGELAGSNEKAPNNTPPMYDVETYKNYHKAIEPGEPVVITEKIHGSNARFIYQDSLFGGKMYAGSRKFWKSAKSNCIWRKCLAQNPWIEEWCRAHPNHTLYGEVVPTQDGYKYGCAEGEVKFFVFDVRDPKNEWIPPMDLWREAIDADLSLGGASWEEVRSRLNLALIPVGGLVWVPVLYIGPFDDVLARTVVDGPSNVPGAKHIREGIVIKTAEEKYIRGLGRCQLKIVSNKFLEGQK